MHVHIALYRWKSSAKHQDIDDALADITSLATRIPDIVEISCAQNASAYNAGYTHVILVRAESQEAIDAYRSHPIHAAAAKRIEAMERHGIGVDFVTKNSMK